jgi:hypothetical protein
VSRCTSIPQLRSISHVAVGLGAHTATRDHLEVFRLAERQATSRRRRPGRLG